jgi:hypothetical protein
VNRFERQAKGKRERQPEQQCLGRGSQGRFAEARLCV